MYLQKIFSPLISLVISILLFTSCDQPQDSSAIQNAEDEAFVGREDNQTHQDQTDLQKPWGAYSYMIPPTAGVVPVVTAEEPLEKLEKVELQEGKAVKTSQNPYQDSKTGAIDMPKLINLNLEALPSELKVNRPPVYGKDCIGSDLPIGCSSENVAQYIKASLDFPEKALKPGEQRTELVTFLVDKNGTVKNILVQHQTTPCAPCASAAKAVVEAMPDKWYPALQNGKPIDVTIQLPIEFQAKR